MTPVSCSSTSLHQTMPISIDMNRRCTFMDSHNPGSLRKTDEST
jgi:hypothetical protein